MFRWILSAALCLSVASFAAAQNTSSNTANNASSNTTNAQIPQGTKVVEHEQSVIVQPKTKPVSVDSGIVKAAQTALQQRGYNPGAVDGIVGQQTSAAISQFQADQGLQQTGNLDAATLAKLNVGGTAIISSAPADLGRAGKAAGHNIVGGHPVAAGKAIGTGAESFGKRVVKGSKALAVRGVDKAGKGISSIGNKVQNSVDGDNNKSNTHANQNDTENQTQGQSEPQNQPQGPTQSESNSPQR